MKRLALILLVALALAGCARASAGGDAVVLWHSYQGDERAALEAIADEFNRTHPDLRVELVSVPYDAFADKITNAIPNGNGPDLFVFAHDRIGDWVATGLVEPIEYYVDEALADRYAYDALAAMAYQKSLYGLPLAVKSVILFYRTDLVDTPPATTDELIARGPEWSKGDRYALVYDNADLYGHALWLHGFGGRVFDDDGNLALATAEATEALGFARALVTRHHLVPRELTPQMVATLFNEGKAAMAISGPWFIGDIAEDVPWAVAPLPVVSPTGRHAAPYLGAEGVLMSARARDKDAAFKVMAALTGDGSAIIRARDARQVVPNLAAYDEPDIGGDPVQSAFRAQLEHTVPMPATPGMRTVWTPYKNALQKVIAQGADPADALRAVEREVRGYLGGDATP